MFLHFQFLYRCPLKNCASEVLIFRGIKQKNLQEQVQLDTIFVLIFVLKSMIYYSTCDRDKLMQIGLGGFDLPIIKYGRNFVSGFRRQGQLNCLQKQLDHIWTLK